MFKLLELPRATLYDRLKRNNKLDKYQEFKESIVRVFRKSMGTYGYRRIHLCTLRAKLKCCPTTMNNLIGELGLEVNVYYRHSGNYHSYK